MDVNAVKRRFAKTTILARTVCFSFSAVTSVMLATLFPAVMYAQSARNTSAQAPGSTGGSPNASQSGTAKDGWVVRDPTTGRIFHQQLVPVSVPTVRWENKPITTTLMQPQWVTQVVPESRVAYQSQTQMVLQPYWQGWWNPLRQPTLAYRHVPVTTWQPTTTTASKVVTSQQLIPVQRTIQVPHPVTGTQTVQQLVQTEIPLATGFSQAIGLPSAPMTAVASISPSVTSAASTNQQPLLGRFPLLAGRPTWQSPAWQGQTWENANWQSAWPTIPAPTGRWVASNGATGSTNASPQLIASNVSGSSTSGPVASTPLGGYSSGGSSSQSSMANKNSGLRPVARAMQNILPPAYNAPMQSASRASGSWDVMQSGLRPTVLR